MADQAPATVQDIIALERAYWDAMKVKDGRRAAALSGDPCLVAGRQGLSRIARDRMAAMTEQGDWVLTAYDFEAVEVLLPAPGVAVIAYKVRQSVTMGGKPAAFTAADMSTWVQGPNGWECHAHSETILDD